MAHIKLLDHKNIPQNNFKHIDETTRNSALKEKAVNYGGG